MYICIYVYVYMYMYICIYIYVYMYICIYAYVYMCICIYVYMHMYIYVFFCVCVNVEFAPVGTCGGSSVKVLFLYSILFSVLHASLQKRCHVSNYCSLYLLTNVHMVSVLHVGELGLSAAAMCSLYQQ